MSTAETKRIDGRYIVIPLVIGTAIVGTVFVTIQLSGRGTKETNFLLLSYTAGLRDIEEGRYAGAVKNFTSVIKSGTRPEAYGWRGEAYLRMKKYVLAEADFRKATENDPDLPANHAGLGVALMGQGDTSEAMAEFDKAVELFQRHDVSPPGPVRRTGDDPTEARKLREAAINRAATVRER